MGRQRQRWHIAAIPHPMLLPRAPHSHPELRGLRECARRSARDICGGSGWYRVAKSVLNGCSKGRLWIAWDRGFSPGWCCETWGGRGRSTGEAFPRNGGGNYSYARVLFPVHYLSSHLAKIRPAHGRTNLNHTRQRQPPHRPRLESARPGWPVGRLLPSAVLN